MSFKVKEFATIRILSSDVAKSKDWYQRLFGIETVEDLENFASFKICGTKLEICLADLKSPLSEGGSVGYWLVDDLDRAIAKAVELEGSVYRGPLKVKELGRRIVQIKDPFGSVFGLEAREN